MVGIGRQGPEERGHLPRAEIQPRPLTPVGRTLHPPSPTLCMGSCHWKAEGSGTILTQAPASLGATGSVSTSQLTPGPSNGQFGDPSSSGQGLMATGAWGSCLGHHGKKGVKSL